MQRATQRGGTPRVAALAADVDLDVEGLGTTRVLPRDAERDDEILTRITPEQAVEETCQAASARRLRPYARSVRPASRADAARQRRQRRDALRGRAAAFWALLGPEVELAATDYDVGDTAARSARAAIPARKSWSRRFSAHVAG